MLCQKFMYCHLFNKKNPPTEEDRKRKVTERIQNFSKNDKVRSKNFPSQQVVLRARSGILLHSLLPQKKKKKEKKRK